MNKKREAKIFCFPATVTDAAVTDAIFAAKQDEKETPKMKSLPFAAAAALFLSLVRFPFVRMPFFSTCSILNLLQL